jgi:CarD family transcriptional regulator
LLKGDKDLSFGERKMLDTARSLLVKEISIAKTMSEDEVEAEFRSIFKC